jgi:hypothetical protein
MPFAPSIAPSCEDQDVYLVRDQFGQRLGRAWRETDEADTDFETLIRHLLEANTAIPFALLHSTRRRFGLAMFPTTQH